MADQTNSIVRDAELLARRAAEIKHVEEHPLVLVEKGEGRQDVVDLEGYLPSPLRIRERVSVFDENSFGAYFNRFCPEQNSTPKPLLAINDEMQQIRAVFDYHGILQEKEGGSHITDPQWGSHTLALSLKHSDQWETWASHNNKRMGQVDFAEFIEDNMPDIVDPEGAKLFEVVSNLSSHRNVKFGSNVRLDNGQVQFTYEEEIKNTTQAGQIEIPQIFTLGLKPFLRSSPYSLKARFRYRISEERRLLMWYSLVRPERVLEDAFDLVQHRITRDLGDRATVIHGQ